jgi:SAM-dependent methyltransferase
VILGAAPGIVRGTFAVVLPMHDLSRFNPTGRFAGLADNYARYRPTYPADAIDFVIARAELHKGDLVADMGCGTGISSRLLAERGLRVVGIEPNEEMRARATAELPAPDVPSPIYQAGKAEATGLKDGTVDGVVAAQAFHWFQVEPALREFHRILKQGRWVALLWNERDESDPFTSAYGTVVRTTPDAAAVEVPRGKAGEPLLKSPLFRKAELVLFANEQALDEDGMLGRAFSASYAPRDPEVAAAFANGLRDVFARFQQGGQVVIRYQTSVYIAQRR